MSRKAQLATVLWVYRIPSDERPDHLVFRRVCRVEVRRPAKRLPDVPPPPAPPEPKRAGKGKADAKSKGKTATKAKKG